MFHTWILRVVTLDDAYVCVALSGELEIVSQNTVSCGLQDWHV